MASNSRAGTAHTSVDQGGERILGKDVIVLRAKKEASPWTFVSPDAADFEELARMHVVEEKAYTRKMQDLWKELKESAEKDERVDYWNFIRGSDFAATIARAQLVSFLVTYGYANLQRKGNSMFLVPKARPDPHPEGSPLSFPIPITKEVLIRAK